MVKNKIFKTEISDKEIFLEIFDKLSDVKIKKILQKVNVLKPLLMLSKSSKTNITNEKIREKIKEKIDTNKNLREEILLIWNDKCRRGKLKAKVQEIIDDSDIKNDRVEHLSKKYKVNIFEAAILLLQDEDHVKNKLGEKFYIKYKEIGSEDFKDISESKASNENIIENLENKTGRGLYMNIDECIKELNNIQNIILDKDKEIEYQKRIIDDLKSEKNSNGEIKNLKKELAKTNKKFNEIEGLINNYSSKSEELIKELLKENKMLKEIMLSQANEIKKNNNSRKINELENNLKKNIGLSEKNIIDSINNYFEAKVVDVLNNSIKPFLEELNKDKNPVQTVGVKDLEGINKEKSQETIVDAIDDLINKL